jgi:hypothetical protein
MYENEIKPTQDYPQSIRTAQQLQKQQGKNVGAATRD